MAIDWVKVPQLTSLLAAANSSGMKLRTLLQQGSRTQCFTLVGSRYSQETVVSRLGFGRKYGPFVVTGFGLGLLGGALSSTQFPPINHAIRPYQRLTGSNNSGSSLNIYGAVSMGLVVIYIVFVIFQIKNRFLVAHSDLVNQKKFDNGSQVGDDVQDIVAAWRGAAFQRTLLSTFATLLGLVAAYRGLGN
ncbi:hypothetical protein NOF04DRAFT_1273642 [Fusarium oxysporum II5]|nr:hypothetical protein NOF04DRAFT_1273642 [Fusarium oxysporum II5]